MISRLANRLEESPLVEAAGVVAAIRSGWRIEAFGEAPRCSELLRIYEAKLLTIKQLPTEYAVRLAAATTEFVENLRAHSSERGRWFAVKSEAPHHFLVFELDPSQIPIGCLRVQVNPEASANWSGANS
jgi:hypothetical protein